MIAFSLGSVRHAALAATGDPGRVGGSLRWLSSSGPGAAAIERLWWILFAMAMVVFALVLVLLVVASVRRRDGELTEDRVAGERWVGGGNLLVVGGGVVMPAVVILVVMVLTVTTASSVRALGDPNPPEIQIEVVGYKFWWDVVYVDADVRDANEVKIPVGEPVEFQVSSADVIHSFWVAELGPKIDMTPGHVNTVILQADEPGVYRGICTEYCGVQHARMQFVVEALEPDAWAQWLDDRREVDRSTGLTASQQQGLEVYESAQCVECHTIAGVNEWLDVGPDLTHLASRTTLAAGTMRNNRGNLGGWILDPQTIKPGNRMPPANLDGPELNALLDYLETLE